MRISSKNKRGDGLKIAYIGLKIGRPLVRV
jgi:hypothetical protein